MTVIQKTIQVPESRTFTMEFPSDVLVGDTADIVVTVTTAPKNAPAKSILDLAGAFANSKTFAGDSVSLIREIRDEW